MHSMHAGRGLDLVGRQSTLVFEKASLCLHLEGLTLAATAAAYPAGACWCGLDLRLRTLCQAGNP
jgi:hypothetical protein